MTDQPLTTIRCKECGHAVSKRDKKCPLCGSPIEQNTQTGVLPRQWLLVLAGAATFFFVISFVVLLWRLNTATSTGTQEASRESRPDQAEVTQAPKEFGANTSPESSRPVRRDDPSATAAPAPQQETRNATVPERRGDQKPENTGLRKAAVDAFGLGKAHLEKREYDLAMRDFTEAVRLNPSYADAFTNRGFVHLYKSDYDRAIQDFGEAIRLRPNSDLFANRALAYFSKGDYEHAIQDYSEAIRLSPADAELLNDRGAAHAGKGDYDRAIQDYDQALRLNPNYPAALNNRGWAYSQRGERDRAIADYLKALKLKPDDALRKHIEAALKSLGVSAGR